LTAWDYLAWIVVAPLAAALVYDAYSDSYPFDLSYFLAAGRVWSTGGDPYSITFKVAAVGWIAPEAAIWAYPPQWWSITVALAAMDPATAVHVWKAVKLLLLVVGLVLIIKVLPPSRDGTKTSVVILATAAVILTADATRISLHLGQTSEIVFSGIALLLFGAERGRILMQTAGLIMLCLKPQLGLFFLALSFGTTTLRPAAWSALVISGIGCLPILWQQEFEGTLASARHWLDNLGLYGALDWNRPVELTGVTHLVALSGLPVPTPMICVAAAIAGTLWIKAHAERRGETFSPSRLLLTGLAVLSAFVPLHAYDLIFLPVFLLVAPVPRPWGLAAIALANLLIWRASSLAFAFFLYERSPAFGGALIGSVIQAGIATAATSLVFFAVLRGWKPALAREYTPSFLRGLP